MNMHATAAESRREFLRSSMRWSLLSLLAGICVSNLRRRSHAANSECNNNGVCAACSWFGECRLPDALSYRGRLRED